MNGAQSHNSDGDNEVARLVQTLHETEQRLKELTGGEVDAVMHPAGDSYLLRNAQERLRDSETGQRRLATQQTAILNALPAHIALLDGSGVVVSVNDGWRAFADDNLFRAADYGIGRNYIELCENAVGPCSEGAHDVAAGIRAVLRREKSEFSFDYPCHSGNERRWFRMVVSPLLDGGLSGAVVAHLNVTKRMQAEDELRVRALQQKAIAELGQAALTSAGLADFMEKAVLAVKKTFAVEYCSVLQLLPDKDAVQFIAGFGLEPLEHDRSAATRKTVYGYTLLTEGQVILEDLATDERFRDSRLFWQYGIVSGISVVIPGEGRPWGALAAFAKARRFFTADDIGFIQSVAHLIAEAIRRQNAEEALRESKLLLQIASESARLGGWIVDLPADHVRWSDEVCAIHEVPPGSAPTLDEAIQTYAPQSRERIREAFDACVRDGAPFYEQLQLITATGRAIWVRVIGEAVRNSNGTIVRVQGALQDITKRRAIEEQFKQSQRLESIGQLTGGVAHDFNNLLTVIKGNAELLVEHLTGDDELRTMAETTLKAARRGADLTHRLLAFARRQPLVPKIVDVNDLLGGMEGLLRRSLSENVEIEILRSPSLWRILVDPAEFEGAVLNLCVNARDAMPKGGRVTVTTENIVVSENLDGETGGIAPGEYVMVAVSDTGSGIAAHDLNRVFDPFFTTKEVGKGTGLGLSMVYGFIKQSRGDVKIRSEVGAGTVVEMLFPRSNEVVDFADETPLVPSICGGSEKILFVEDDDLVRQHVRNHLDKLGYHVLVAANGPAALEIVKKTGDIDLLFTDIVMPGGLNGRELADQAFKLRPGLRILYASGYTDDAIVHGGRLDEGTNLLSKPYTRAELAQKIRAVLAQSDG
jgi:PAS domain S-box-containing protein